MIPGRAMPDAIQPPAALIHPRRAGRLRPLARLALVAVLVSACTGTAAGTPPLDAWRTASLHDVLGGADFRVSDLRGRVVAIETMAISCLNCRLQQQAARAAIAEVHSPDLVYISIDVDPNEREADLAAYAREAGFAWRFAVASPDLARSLAATFGDEILSPPSTPLVIIGPHGELVTKRLGIQGTDELVSLLKANLP